ncbi:SCP-like protein [Ostertagia ostertagi]
MDDSTRDIILEFHNGFRTQLAKGLSPGYRGNNLLPAENLYKMRWSCNLEAKAVKATKSCDHYNIAAENLAQNIYYSNDEDYIQKRGKKMFLIDAMYEWTMPAEYYSTKTAIEPSRGMRNVTSYRNGAQLTYVNMAAESIYEVGCNYEQCKNGGIAEAVFTCFYNKIINGGAVVYLVGDGTGCAQDPVVCTLGKSRCEGLLCEH